MKPNLNRFLSIDNPEAEAARLRMVREQILARDVTDPRVLEVMRAVPRHPFIPEPFQTEAYQDAPQPIACGQTISQPYIVASMTEQLRLRPDSRVLEVGTGSGYQTAVLAELSAAVYTIECQRELYECARELLGRVGYDNIQFRLADGAVGWPEAAPFDAVLVTAAAPEIPPALVQQLADGGRMIIPVRMETGNDQILTLVYREAGQVRIESLYAVRFVPLLQPGGRPY